MLVFPANSATSPNQKRGCYKTAILTCFFLIKMRIFSKYPVIAIFSRGVDVLLHGTQNNIVRLPIGARIGHI